MPYWIELQRFFVCIKTMLSQLNITLGGKWCIHYSDGIMSAMVSPITSVSSVYFTVLFRRKTNKTSKLRVTGLCDWDSPATGEFPVQRASNAENVSIWWRHHVCVKKKAEYTILLKYNIYMFISIVLSIVIGAKTNVRQSINLLTRRCLDKIPFQLKTQKIVI